MAKKTPLKWTPIGEGREVHTLTEGSGFTPSGQGTLRVDFQVNQAFDVEELDRLQEALYEIKTAGFTHEEESELADELLAQTDPLLRGALYLRVATQQGQPVLIESEEGKGRKKKKVPYQLYFDKDYVIRKKRIKPAEFGTRDPKDNITFETEHAIEDPPFKMSDAERMIWANSPAAVISAGIQRGDPAWIEFLQEIQQKVQEQEEYEDMTLENFFQLQRIMYMLSKTEAPDDNPGAQEEVRNSRLAWSFLSRARVFHIDPAIYREIYVSTEVYCTEQLSGLKYTPPKRIGNAYVYEEETEKSREEARIHGEALRRLSPEAPMPTNFPFEVMFLGYGPGLLLTRDQAEGKFYDHGKSLPPSIKHVFVVGAIITETGYVFECYKAVLHDGGSAYICEPLRTPEKGFTPTVDLSPWYLPKVVDFITSHKMFVLEQDMNQEQRRGARDIRKLTNKGGKRNTHILWTPPPYYRMRMRNLVIRDRARSLFPSPGVARTYRTDVVGHTRLYVRRGPLPLSPEKKAVLLKREYKVFENMFPPPEVTEAMVRKGHDRKHSSEWVAVREIWIDEHMNSNDDSLPYVPALRTTAGSPPGAP